MKTNAKLLSIVLKPLTRKLLFACGFSLSCFYAHSQQGVSVTGRYIAIGSSLSAGVRDGGLSTERQKTSFPTLLSKQMGIENFRSPSIESTGSLSVKGNPTHGISFSWTEPRKDLSFEKLSGPVDNYAIPFQKVTSLALNLDQTSEWPDQYGKASFTFLNSFLSGENEKISYLELIDKESKEIALFSYELGIEDFVEYLKSGGFNTDLQFLQQDREGYFPENNLISGLVRNGARGVILNLPQIYELPFFSAGIFEELRNKIGDVVYAEKFSKSSVRPLTDRANAFKKRVCIV